MLLFAAVPELRNIRCISCSGTYVASVVPEHTLHAASRKKEKEGGCSDGKKKPLKT